MHLHLNIERSAASTHEVPLRWRMINHPYLEILTAKRDRLVHRLAFIIFLCMAAFIGGVYFAAAAAAFA